MRSRRVFEAFETFEAVYCAMPPIELGDAPSVPAPFAIDLSFSGHEAAWVQEASGATRRRAVVPGTGGVTGAAPASWVEVPRAFQCVEFRPSPALRRSIADELAVPHAAELADLDTVADPVLWAAAARFRAHATDGWPLDALAADALIESLVRSIMIRTFAGKPPRATNLRLDPKRLGRVVAYMTAHLDQRQSLARLADVAALSRWHFIRAFKATTGMTPHGFLLAHRMERARTLIVQAELPMADIASRVGYANGRFFARAFKRHHGVTPTRFRAIVSADRRR